MITANAKQVFRAAVKGHSDEARYLATLEQVFQTGETDDASLREVEKVIAKSMRMDAYQYIMQNVRAVNVAQDTAFQKKFVGFYKVRRNKVWRDAYFDYFEQSKGKMPSFEEVLTCIYSKTDRVEASFSSKMLASLDPNMPIWDSIVLERVGLAVKSSAKREKKLKDAPEMYARLCKEYADYLQTPDARENIALFDKVMPHYSWMSDTKKIDFLMWGDKS